MRNGGRDYIAMQVLLRIHKGENKEIVLTWFPLVEEKPPMLCPISKLLAKARAEGVVDLDGYDTCNEPFFNTKLSVPAVYMPWKKEFWHNPVVRKTVESVEGPVKSDEPEKAFDDFLESHGKAAGLPDQVSIYVFRRGTLEVLDSKSTLSCP